MRSVTARTSTLALKYNFRWILHALLQYDYFKAFILPDVLHTLFKMIQTSIFSIKRVSHFIIFRLFECFPRFLSLRKKRHHQFNTMGVAVFVLELLHLSNNLTCTTAVHIPCATPEVEFTRAALSLWTLTPKSRYICTVITMVAQCCYMLQYAMMLTNAREVGDSIREGRSLSRLKSGLKNALCSCEWRINIKYCFYKTNM